MTKMTKKFSHEELSIIESCVKNEISLSDTQQLLKLRGFNRKLSSIKPKYENSLSSHKRKKRYQERANANIEEHRLKTLFYSAKQRAKNKNIDFTIKPEDIKKAFEATSGKCKFTEREFRFTLVGENRETSNLDAPSLDRIDNTKGYTPDNIQIVSLAYNKMKSDSDIEEIKEIKVR